MVFTEWYHAEALELEESRLSCVLGFKCCRCRRIKSSVCPYSSKGRMSIDVKKGSKKEHSGANSDSGTLSELKESEGMKTHTRTSKKEHSGADSDSGTLSELKECGPTSTFFPREDVPRRDYDPFLLSLLFLLLLPFFSL